MTRIILIAALLAIAVYSMAYDKDGIITDDIIYNQLDLKFYERVSATEITVTTLDSEYEKICIELRGDMKRCIGLNELYRMLVIRDAKQDK